MKNGEIRYMIVSEKMYQQFQELTKHNENRPQ